MHHLQMMRRETHRIQISASIIIFLLFPVGTLESNEIASGGDGALETYFDFLFESRSPERRNPVS
jgi:hypothetical protein